MTLLRRVFTVSGWTLVSRVLGLLRDRLLGGTFGAGAGLSAFMMAFALPNLMRNLFGEGALAAAFVPRYVRLRGIDGPRAERFAGGVLTRLAGLLSLLCALGMIGAGLLLLLPGVPARFELIAWLALPQLPYLILICLAAIMAGVLHGRHHFWVPAFSPVLLNLVLIGMVLAWRELAVLPWAVLTAGCLQLAAHLLALWRHGGLPPPGMGAAEEVAELRRAMGPTLVATGAHQLNALLDYLIAFTALAGTVDGAVAILYFGNRLLQFPMALVAHGVGTAVYPDLSGAAASGWQASAVRLRESMDLLLLFLLPAAVGLVVVAEPLVRCIYQTGLFGEEAVLRTVLVTRFYALALIPLSCTKLCQRAFHAHLDQRTPMRIGLAMVGLNLVLNLLLVHTPLQEAGLALATALSGSCAFGAYLVVLHRRGAGGVLDACLPRLPLAGSAVMGLAVWAWLHWAPDFGLRGFAAWLSALLTAVGLGLAIYTLFCGGRVWRQLRGGAN